jgi:hypothetical protein
MNKAEEIEYLLDKTISAKDRFWRLGELAGVVSKEKPETWAVYQRIRKYIHPGSLVAEIGAGHGLLGTWLAWTGQARVKLYDRRYSIKPPIGYHIAVAARPDIAKCIEINSNILRHDDDGIEADSIIGVHCCGDLTDYCLRLAAMKRLPLAIMTCCHGKKSTGTIRCESNLNLAGIGIDGTKSVDISRAAWLLSQGYKVWVSRIAEGITGEPTMIIGCPLKN